MYITNNIDKGKQTDKQEKKTINNIQLKCRFVPRIKQNNSQHSHQYETDTIHLVVTNDSTCKGLMVLVQNPGADSLIRIFERGCCTAYLSFVALVLQQPKFKQLHIIIKQRFTPEASMAAPRKHPAIPHTGPRVAEGNKKNVFRSSTTFTILLWNTPENSLHF